MNAKVTIRSGPHKGKDGNVASISGSGHGRRFKIHLSCGLMAEFSARAIGIFGEKASGAGAPVISHQPSTSTAAQDSCSDTSSAESDEDDHPTSVEESEDEVEPHNAPLAAGLLSPCESS